MIQGGSLFADGTGYMSETNDNYKWLSSYQVLINGWIFNFAVMRATRNEWIIPLKVNAGHVCSFRRDENNHIEFGRMDFSGKWRSFFTEPEHGYNDLIDEAYSTYCLERAIRDSDPKTNTEE